MEKFDRELQKEMLNILVNAYPGVPDDLDYHSDLIDSTEPGKLLANLLYLAGHRLITAPNANSTLEPDESRWMFENAVITVVGIDFMLNDGGLSAILNVQTIKIHRETVVVLEDLITISNMSDAEKQKAKSTLSELSVEALKTVVQTVTAAGLVALTK